MCSISINCTICFKKAYHLPIAVQQKHFGVNLVKVVAIFADYFRKQCPANRLQLGGRERAVLVAVLEEEAITKLEMIELHAHDAGEGRPDHAVDQRQLGDAAREQINVLDRLVVLGKASPLCLGHVLVELLERSYLLLQVNIAPRPTRPLIR